MARVVHQRTGPPYLLIIMVFLFLIATTLAVLGYLQADKVGKQLASSKENLDKLASSEDLGDAKIRQMMTWYDTPPQGEKRKTVVRRLLGQLGEQAVWIAGKDAEVAAKQAKTAFARIGSGSERGLANEAMTLCDLLEKAHKLIEEKQRLLEEKQKQLDNKDQMFNVASAELQGKVSLLEARVENLDKALADRHKQYQDGLDRARLDWGKQREELDKTIAVQTQKIQDLSTDKSRQADQTQKLLKQVADLTQPTLNPMQVGLQPDGTVRTVLPEDYLCYINLGTDDRVTPGLTFSVYPPSGIPKDGKGKGTIVVTTVLQKTSECRIEHQQRDDPIVPGDLVANLAFDRTRVYTFVVEGAFDLYGTGQVALAGAEDAKGLIRRFGGKVADQIGTDTDFVILGEEPQRPPKPADSAAPQVWKAYQEQLKVADRYSQVKALAETRNIAILNPSRFLAFVGYTPTRAGG